MKVLFAVNNDEISNAIKKKYQEKYKDILSYKNVYYFNAIIKELQRDKTYDRIVISEDLEPFANNNYDTIDKFLFDRLDTISDEATNEEGNDSQIILICTDRRNQSDEILAKFFGIGIYCAIIGQDRSIDEVCRLIHKPRTKKEAKQYYRIDADKVDYQSENENDVNEAEIQNILAHYKRLGKNEERYVDSFNNIASQYNDIQLKIIIRYLPLNVKAILEERSPKYQELTAFTRPNNQVIKSSSSKKLNNYKGKEEDAINVKMLKEQKSRASNSKPIVIPSNVSNSKVKKLIKEEDKDEESYWEEIDDINDDIDTMENVVDKATEIKQTDVDNFMQTQEKKKRGRPAKPKAEIEEETIIKKKRGRPKKNVEQETDIEKTKNVDKEIEKNDDNELDLFNLYDNDDDNNNNNNTVNEESIDLFDLDDEDNSKEDVELFGLGDDDKEDISKSENKDIDIFNLDKDEDIEDTANFGDNLGNRFANNTTDNNQISNIYNKIGNKEEFVRLLTKDKKVVSFVGTTKNGTSFIVNNVGELLSSMGISTAILDMTKTKNAYYIYTNNDEKLRTTASGSIQKLKKGIAEGIQINRNLTVFTNLPGEDEDYSDASTILSTLVKKYSVVLIDCDFNTPIGYFDMTQEIYLIQSMDVLTIQPLTAFLRDLKAQKILKPEKLKVVINKAQKVKGLSWKILIGGIAFYNDPTMSYMTELFDKDKIPYCIIPFEVQNYVKYLNSLVECSVTLNGYTKEFMQSLKELVSMIYPLLNRQTYSPRGEKYKDAFSNETNDTLNKMKRKYQ